MDTKTLKKQYRSDLHEIRDWWLLKNGFQNVDCFCSQTGFSKQLFSSWVRGSVPTKDWRQSLLKQGIDIYPLVEAVDRLYFDYCERYSKEILDEAV